MSTIKIRPATKQDAAAVAHLGKITFTETFAHYFRYGQDLTDYLESTFSVPKIEKSIEKSNNRYWLAIADGLPVGYAKLKLDSKSGFVHAEPVCQLQKIYVLKDFLSMKIGCGLQNCLFEEARHLGFREIWLSVLQENERAVRFYTKSGFTKIGTHDFQIGRENFRFFVMQKELLK